MKKRYRLRVKLSIEAIEFDGTPAGALRVLDAFDIPAAKFQPELNNLERGMLLIPCGNGQFDKAEAGYFVLSENEEHFWVLGPTVFHAMYRETE